MKKRIILALMLAAILALAACGDKTDTTPSPEPKPSDTPTPTVAVPAETVTDTPTPTDPAADPNAKSEGVMTHAQYVATAVDEPVLIECYVQATQSWYQDQISVYAADPDGGYFIYNMACSEEDAKKLTKGTKIKVTGYMAQYRGLIEVAKGATFEIEEGSYIVENPFDVTSILGSADIAAHMNEFVQFNDLVIEPSIDGDGNKVAFLYKYNGTGQDGDDLYFNVNSNGSVYTFTVESYLCGPDTDIYKAVKDFAIGDVVDLEGFLYWYDGINPHITGATAKYNVARKSDGVMTYDEYIAAAVDDPVVIECYVQDHQSWYNDKIIVYAADLDGGYLAYNLACTKEDSEKLVPGTKIKITGYKANYHDEIEVAENGASFEFEDGFYIAPITDVTSILAEDELYNYQNRYVRFSDLTVAASTDGDGNEVAFLYKYNGSGSDGDDLYFNVTDGTNTYTFTVESYLRGAGTDVYEAVKALNIGDQCSFEGFLYWYDKLNPHITAVIQSAVVE